ncbi:MAG: type II secretion system F family protein [Xanthobacteraceae bacterium]|jgi:tight adherence protein C
MDILRLLTNDGNSTLVGVLVFLAAGTLAFCIMAIVRVQGSVRRRAANIGRVDPLDRSAGSRSLRHSSLAAAQRLIEYTTKHYSSGSTEETRVLRRRMIQAGIYDTQAVAYFFFGRVALAIGLATLAFLFAPAEQGGPVFWLLTGLAGIVGYVVPSLYIDRRIKVRKFEHQAGFPDFMDLLVVCADAGLSMEASLDRVGRELSDSYPSLSANIHMANLEIRAGRTMSEALEHLGDRLGLDEARSFAILIQQSAELGSSITDALRVYSDDMRHKRLSRAEEKAYSLPAKLALPMMICIFPVLFVVILLPVFVRLHVGNY